MAELRCYIPLGEGIADYRSSLERVVGRRPDYFGSEFYPNSRWVLSWTFATLAEADWASGSVVRTNWPVSCEVVGQVVPMRRVTPRSRLASAVQETLLYMRELRFDSASDKTGGLLRYTAATRNHLVRSGVFANPGPIPNYIPWLYRGESYLLTAGEVQAGSPGLAAIIEERRTEALVRLAKGLEGELSDEFLEYGSLARLVCLRGQILRETVRPDDDGESFVVDIGLSYAQVRWDGQVATAIKKEDC